jgi:hypothetical protein
VEGQKVTLHYEIIAKGLCAQAKIRCLEKSKIVFKCYKYSYIDIQKMILATKELRKH